MGEISEYDRIQRIERFEGLRERLRRLESLLHPLHAAECDLDGFESLIEAFPLVMRGSERVRVRYASGGAGAADAPMPAGLEAEIIRKKVPPVAKPGRGRGWAPRAGSLDDDGPDDGADALVDAAS